MTWVVWRQGRSEAILVVGLLGALGLLLILTGAHMRSVFGASHLSPCTNDAASPPAVCGLLVGSFRQRFDGLNQLGPWLGLIPGLVGVLMAAPFVLELDQGTYRLALTQSVTPRRWINTRIGLLLLGAVLCGGLMIALATWWRHPLDSLGGRIGPNEFDLEGFVPIAYTLFAAAAVLAVGTVSRRTGLAVASGFGAYLVARLLLRSLRQHLIPPLHALIAPPKGPYGIRHAWVISESFTDPHGHPVPNGAVGRCFGSSGDLEPGCLARHHVVSSFVYEPASRFWSLQAIEAGIFLSLAAMSIGLAIWWFKHRLT